MIFSFTFRVLAFLLIAAGLLFTAPRAVAELGKGLVAYYPFDSAGATQPNRATPLTGESFPNDSVTLIQQAAITGISTRAGTGALLLDGNGDYADIVGNPVKINGDWTVSVWFRPDTAGLGLDGTKRFQVFETSGGTFPISYSLRGEGGTAEQTSFEMTSQANTASGLPSSYLLADSQTDSWHHILITYNSATKVMRGYLDGVSRHLFSVEGLLGYTGFHLGTYRTANDRWFKGRLDEVAIWQRALSGEEAVQVWTLGSNGRPLFIDSDSDGLSDSWEIDQFGNLNETADGDRDGDGLTNAEEYANNSSPTVVDTDGDQLSDGAEVHIYGTRPDLFDSDNDGLGDGEELARVPASNPNNRDTDGDGLSDGEEARAQTNPTLADSDADGFTDFVEAAAGSNPLNSDSHPNSVPISGLDHVIISEFVASNWNGINDEDLESSDWMELWNPTATAVDLSGWHLTDDLGLPMKWRFPSRILQAGGRLIVFASGKNRTPVSGNLHTNFELSAGGGSLALTNGAGQLVSGFENYPEQRVNVGYGFFGVAPPLAAGWLGLPTPGTANPPTGLIERVRDTTFSVQRGLFQAPFQVTVTSSTPGATLAYTTDGTLPGATHGTQSAVSSAAPSITLTISTTTTLRVVAHKPGWLETNADTQTYVFPTDVLRQSGPPAGSETLPWGRLGPDWAMDPDVVTSADSAVRMVAGDLAAIPTVSLVLPFADMWGINGIYPNGEGIPRDASFELLNPIGSNRAFQARGQVHIFGGSTAVRWKMDKLSMRFRFSDDFHEKVFTDSPVEHFKTLVLDARSNNTWNHPIAEQRVRGDYTRDEVTADLQNLMGGFAPHSQHAHVYINGLYWGVYTLHERPDHHFAQEYLGGSDSEFSAQKHDASDVVRGPVVNGVLTNADYVALLALANADLSIRANYEALAARLDIEDFIRYMVINYVAGNWDWASHNWYATYNRVRPEGRWRFHSWDAEHTWRDLGEDSTVKNDPQGPTHIQQQLALNSEYRLRFADAVHRHLFNGGQLTGASIQRVFEARLRGINEAIRGESARWGDTYDITFPRTRRTWLKEAAHILGYVPPFPNNPETSVPAVTVLPGQPNALLAHLRTRGWYPGTANSWSTEAPEFNQHGGSVPGGFVLSIGKMPAAAPGTVYFTMDGSDPRVAFSGAPGGSARVYADAIPLSTSVTVKARVLKGVEWSPLTEAFFTVGADRAGAMNLVVSELMYHPLPPTSSEAAAGFSDGNDFEFIELMNISDKTIDLGDVSVSGGVVFNFNTLPAASALLAPGARVVLVENAAAFAARYGSGANVAGVYAGNLKNSGERLTVSGKDGALICEFDYSDAEPWPAAADGVGCSLVLNNPRTGPDHRLPSSWRASAWPGGAPGLPDSSPMPLQPLADDDRDGVNNLIAYATAGNPAPALAAEWLARGSDSGEYVIVYFHVSRAADGFICEPELSTDLVTWSAGALEYHQTKWNADGTATVAWRSKSPRAALGSQVFVRLGIRVVAP
ncbi:MAG: hypothetical protein JWL59_3351 [Chthoniobacteraceae bacterium]|nr:hypothetical protein [Chthoniobacteraceae bacterium]